MIITEDKDKKLPLPVTGENNPYLQSSSSSSASAPPPAHGSHPEFAPPPYEPSNGTVTDTTFSTAASASSGPPDLLSGNPEDYSAGPSVLPPFVNPIPLGLPKVNKLRVQKQNESIKETFVIDANLPAPPGSPDKALDLYSNNGSVQAKVYLMGVDVKRRTELAAKSKNGSVKFQIAECPRTMPISVSAESHNGSVTVLLPPKFTGPLKIEHKNGSVTLYPSLKARTRTLDESSTVRRCWVGEWPGDVEWEGDECFAGSHNGSVRIGFWEGEPVEQQSVGFFKRLFG